MDLREGEQILKIYRHHPTPFIFSLVKVFLGTFPFFVIIYLLKDAMSMSAFFVINLILVLIFSLILMYKALVYWLDRLVITNRRIIHIDWKYLTIRNEYEAELTEIQDISTKEKGILAHFRAFDYGEFKLETASRDTVILFSQAPNPEGIRQYVYKVKPNK